MCPAGRLLVEHQFQRASVCGVFVEQHFGIGDCRGGRLPLLDVRATSVATGRLKPPPQLQGFVITLVPKLELGNQRLLKSLT